MSIADFIGDLGRPIAYYPGLARLIGVKECVFVCQLLYWQKKYENRVEFYKSSEELQEELGLSYDEQRAVRASLVRQGLISERYARLEHRMYFSLCRERLDEVWENDVNLRKHPNLVPPPSRTRQRQDGEIGDATIVSIVAETTAPETTAKNTEGQLRAEVRPAVEKKNGKRKLPRPLYAAVRKPLHPYPTSENEMYATLERAGVEWSEDYDGNFFETMQENEWKIRGRPIYDWISTYEARLQKTSPALNRH